MATATTITAAQIAAIALPAAQQIILAWMKREGKTSVTAEDLERLSPDDLLKSIGIDISDK